MWRREDRRDLAWLGLWVAVYGLAFAPVLHAVYGHEGTRPAATRSAAAPWLSHAPRAPAPPASDARHAHSHDDAPEGHTHAPGSVEHLLAWAVPASAPPLPQVFWVRLPLPPAGGERPRQGRPPRPTAMPQAP
ncbi:hypothetical protein [Melittangium boletus]|uniref:hypothetical protein n=1 Tax=Melittangium boletus TaxID=83453 RepID=UPI003DA5D364